MSARVGKLEVVHTQTLILPEGEEALVGFQVGGWQAKLKVRFEARGEDPSKQAIEVEAEDDHALVKLVNWKNPLGTATTTPVQFATLNTGDLVYFMVAHWLIGGVNLLELQFLLGGK
jgi:hypothetical protein